MELNYERARPLEGKSIRFKNDNGKWCVGRVVKIQKEGLEIAELVSLNSSDGFGYGFFGPRPFFGRPFFVPFVGFAFLPFFFF